MKYKIVQLSYRTWLVIKEDGTEYYVACKNVTGVHFRRDRDFVCSCIYYTRTGRPCKHIRMVKEFIVKGTKEFDL